ncbi:Nitronate monooxygenase family protein [Candida parapsilosis]|uniref:NMO domain-containing protein n=2 Tax=Candida parapsilosis TaxID=5480 RepID=G8BKQ2_CANPC|nr:uncharacterized protein CPAR2_703310 [Candida parapsilosis]KAF6042105.1 Nitronate monooxygenase family protein [Candida parapsilosis]KAF6042384.1 Nitronate monooxygenase family protein [Candida parapsilosis]KAF6042829.1 Nitronate monooxygenase family protein [Candida parapsilosis]KAF6058162.1 Nitronate monooxygenase family protein [Candida parapsilosis]KAI5903256.1 putative nitronate monooxygenase [Candida parapsilosis]
MSRPSLLKKLNVKYPILQSPMAGVSTPEMAKAVTAGGGLGALPLAPLDFTRDDSTSFDKLDKLVASAGTNAVNLNFFCHEIESAPGQLQVENWKTLYNDGVIDTKFKNVIDTIKFSNGNVSFKEVEEDQKKLEKLIEKLKSIKPAIISFHFGIPSNNTIDELRKFSLVFGTATSLKEALHLSKNGFDGIILQGIEAGGHRGQFLDSFQPHLDEDLSTQALFHKVKQNLGNDAVYIVPAGGITTANSVKHYLDHGADAVQIGTAFLATPESATSKFYSKLLGQESTVMTALISGKPARCIRTPFIDDIVKSNRFELSELPPYGYAYDAYKKLKGELSSNGGPDIGFYLAGQNQFQISKDKSTLEIMNELTSGLS